MVCKTPVLTGFECKREATKLGHWSWIDGTSRTEPLCDHHAQVAPNSTTATFTTRPLPREATQ